MIYVTFFLILGSIFTSTSLILCIKMVMSTYNFGCPTFLTSYHFILTFFLLHCMGKFKFFEITNVVPMSTRWFFGFFGVLSIVSMNFNLKLNSIGFYQLSKLCNIPCMVVYKYFFQKQNTPLNTLFTLFILLAGLFFFTVNDVQFNIIGSIVAAVAVISTTIYQTQTGSLQKQYQISGTQLNYLVGIPQFTICLVSGFFMETHGNNNILEHHFQNMEILMILLTGAFAVFGNVIAFSLIGKAGPITFQVVGHAKTMLIFIFGLIMFPAQQESTEQFKMKIGGLLVSMVGVILYTVFEIKNKKDAEKRKPEEEAREEDPMLPKDQKDGTVFESVVDLNLSK